jgi:hypothetical protein
MSADLQNVHTLPELREWLKVRVRWLRDWHMAPNNPKPIPPAFRDAIFSVFRPPLYPLPSDPTKVEQRANELVWKFHEHTIHQVQDWLQAHDVFGAPDWQGHDPLKDKRILIDALEHLSALLNFIGVRAAERSVPDGPANGEKPEGIDEQTRQRKIAELAPAIRKAYLSYQAALVMAEKKDMEDREAYQLLKEEGLPDADELADYQLPAKDTWCRYVRNARQALSEQKNTPRRGRQHGKSIVRQDQIEVPDNDDE